MVCNTEYMEAIGYGFQRSEGGLDGLHDWLVAHHLDVSAAAFTTDTLWFYYWYFLWPESRDSLTVMVDASTEPGLEVSLTVPSAPSDGSGRNVPEVDVSRLSREFVREVTEPLEDSVRTEITFVPYQIFEARLNERVSAESAQSEREYSSVFVGDLLHDLESLMSAEALRQWVATPNARFGGATPRELLRTPEKRLIRDLILEARHGLPA